MPNRLLTLVLCLLVLLPQQFCTCHLVGGPGKPASDHAAAGTATAPGCPCRCHSDPKGAPSSDCPHAAAVAIADSPKPPALDDLADTPATFLLFTATPIAELAYLRHSPALPWASRVPLYLTFCAFRN